MSKATLGCLGPHSPFTANINTPDYVFACKNMASSRTATLQTGTLSESIPVLEIFRKVWAKATLLAEESENTRGLSFWKKRKRSKCTGCNEVMLGRETALGVIYESVADAAKEMVDSIHTAVHVNNTVCLFHTKKLSNIPCWYSNLKINHDFLAFFFNITPLMGICQTYHGLQDWLSNREQTIRNKQFSQSYPIISKVVHYETDI